MKQPSRWKPSKYVMRKGELIPSLDPKELAVSSRLIGQLIVAKYQSALRESARGLLLDLGCGKVPFYEAYKEFVTDNVCVDWPGSAHGAAHVDVFCDLSSPLPFQDASFDTVLSSDVVEHLPDPDLAFGEMSRLLKPGGTLLLNTPFLYMLHEVPHDYYRFTRYALRRLTESAGMEVIRLEEIGGAAAVIADLLSKAVVSLPALGPYVAGGMQRLGRFLDRRSSNAALSRFPIGYFLLARKPGLPSGP